MQANKKDQPTQKKPKLKFHHLRHPFMVPVFTFFVFFFVGIAIFISQSGQTVGANDSRIVELSINGNTQVIPTTAPTVGTLLQRLNIKINKGDIVQPAETTAILSNNFQINIYRVHPVTVVDNGQKTVISTAETDPRVIAQEAGYTIYPQDYVNTSSDAADSLGQGVLGQEVNINPATPVELNLYGAEVTERTHATTVAQLLASDNIKTSAGNNVLPALNTPLTPNLQILVVPVGQKLISTQQVIPYPVQTVDDPTVPYGEDQVTQAGVNGLELLVEDVSSTGVTSSAPVQQVIISQPVTEIVKHGTGISAIAGGNNITWLKGSVIGVGDYSYVNTIMNRESHWNPDDVNSRGCIGLGQFCDPSNLTVPCPDWQVDAVCQLNAFNSYAIRDYGSWAAAAAHEEDYGWW
jgi:uncharacterized protein YabE (DUF348 family)